MINTQAYGMSVISAMEKNKTREGLGNVGVGEGTGLQFIILVRAPHLLAKMTF